MLVNEPNMKGRFSEGCSGRFGPGHDHKVQQKCTQRKNQQKCNPTNEKQISLGAGS